MRAIPTSLDGMVVIEPVVHRDERGFFHETFRADRMHELGVREDWVQDNHSRSGRGVLRGMHFSIGAGQAKLVRCARGAILDVAVDIRRASPTFGRHVATVLSAENWRQLLIPVGFAHGFVTLEPNTEVVYKVTADYSPPHDRGIRWNDPKLGIDWGVTEEAAILSKKDRETPMLAEAVDLF
jgi:dTDP-4-dehydrorhamnose 3,5-epimerase